MRLTLDIKNNNHQDLIGLNIQDLACRIANKTGTPLTQILHPRAGYEYFLRLPLYSDFTYSGRNEETPHIIIKCNHTADDRRFIAFELKGHPYSRGRWYFVRLLMEQVLDAELYNEYWNKLTVSNVHIAIGSDIKLSNLLFDKLMARKAGIYFNSNGELELIYFQPNNKVQEIAVYDRNAKVKNRNISKRPDEPTRAELRLGKMKVLFCDFLDNHDYLLKFDKLKSYDFSKAIVSGEFDRYEIMAIQAMGLTTFLRRHSKYEVAKFRKRLSPFLIPVIELDTINKLWQKEARNMAVMDPLMPIPNDKELLYKDKLELLYL